MTAIIKEGLLTKQGSLFKTWKSRYFVLKQDSLAYYAGEDAYRAGKKPKGVLTFDNPMDLRVLNSGGTEFRFETEDKTIPIRCYSSGEKKEWMSAVNNFRRGRKEKPKSSKKTSSGGGVRGGGGSGDGQSEGSFYQQQLQKENDANKERTDEDILRRMLAQSEHAKQAGQHSMDILETDREKLIRTDKMLAESNQSLHRSERTLGTMKSYTGAVKNYFTKDRGEDTTFKSDEIVEKHERKATAPESTYESGEAYYGDSRDDMLDQLGNNLASLVNIGNAMGRELDLQDDLMKHVDGVMTNTNDRVRSANEKTQRLIQKN